MIMTRIVMKEIASLAIFMLLSLTDASAQKGPKNDDLFAQDNLVAWCIVPFDNKNRNPAERIAMLKRLGFSQYAYDWRHQHLETFAEEIKLAKENKIFIHAVWIWIDKNADKPEQLSEDNERLLRILKDSGLMTQLWVGFNNNFFEAGDDASRIAVGTSMIKYLRERTKDMATSIGLYNHGDWFGEPRNQLKIIKQLSDPGLGIIYNFHHAHAQIESFPSLLNEMKPYLWSVNINGMKKDGPQILPVGSGDQELEMLRTLKQSGFTGTIGLLGHIETEDVELVLKRNLEGLRKLEKQL